MSVDLCYNMSIQAKDRNLLVLFYPPWRARPVKTLILFGFIPKKEAGPIGPVFFLNHSISMKSSSSRLYIFVSLLRGRYSVYLFCCSTSLSSR